MEAVGRLAGGVAHEFNNRLMTILGNAEILFSKLDSPTWQDHRELLKSCAQSVARACERSTTLTKQLLAFSRKPLTHPEPVDTHQLLLETTTMLQPLLGENIKFDIGIASDVAPIFGNAGQIEQVITNLVLNARDSISDVGCVKVKCHNVDVSESLASLHPGAHAGRHVQITIQDDGAGMSEEVLTHIFEPFFTTKQVGKGTGLGLAMVHGIVSQMSGFITVDSQERVGTTIQVTLPVADYACQTVDTLDTQTHSGNGEVILVCEDEPSVRELISHNLISAGYVVLEAENGDQALALARASDKSIDLLVTDIVMPGMNGFELFKKMSSEMANMQTVFVSGYATEAIDPDVLPSKQHALLHKPFKNEELLKVVWQVLHHPSINASSK